MDATRVQPKGNRGRADEAASLIGKLYGVEREHKDAAPKVRHLARQQRSVPVLAELRAWMLQNSMHWEVSDEASSCVLLLAQCGDQDRKPPGNRPFSPVSSSHNEDKSKRD